MKYGSHIWGGSIHTALLNRVESKAFCLNSPPLTDCLDSLKSPTQCCIFIYFLVHCSSELANCMSLPLLQPCCTRLSTSSHPYSVHLPNERANQYLHSFIPYTGKFWNSLPLSAFPPAHDLNSFERGVSWENGAVINGKSSNWEDVKSGLPQNSVLSHIPFLIHVNDITSKIIIQPWQLSQLMREVAGEI